MRKFTSAVVRIDYFSLPCTITPTCRGITGFDIHVHSNYFCLSVMTLSPAGAGLVKYLTWSVLLIWSCYTLQQLIGNCKYTTTPLLYYLYPPLIRFLLDFSCSYTSPELDLFLIYRWRSKRNHPIRELLKVRLTIFIRHCLNELRFSIHVCIRICWFEDNRIETIEGSRKQIIRFNNRL